MANVLKLWKGAVEPAESGASGNEYQGYKGAVEPAAPPDSNALLATSVESASEVSAPTLAAVHVLLATSVESASEVSAPTAGAVTLIRRLFRLTGVYDQDRNLTGEAS